jgi:CheY-like chemotaxis protein
VTDFVDLAAVLAAAEAGSGEGLAAWHESARTLLLVDQRKIPRGILRSHLEMHQHQVFEFADLKDAIKLADQTCADLILVSLAPGKHPEDDEKTRALLVALRAGPQAQKIPVLGIAEGHGREFEDTVDERINYQDREGMLAAIQALTRQHGRKGTSLEQARQMAAAGYA